MVRSYRNILQRHRLSRPRSSPRPRQSRKFLHRRRRRQRGRPQHHLLQPNERRLHRRRARHHPIFHRQRSRSKHRRERPGRLRRPDSRFRYALLQRRQRDFCHAHRALDRRGPGRLRSRISSHPRTRQLDGLGQFGGDTRHDVPLRAPSRTISRRPPHRGSSRRPTQRRRPHRHSRPLP